MATDAEIVAEALRRASRNPWLDSAAQRALKHAADEIAKMLEDRRAALAPRPPEETIYSRCRLKAAGQ
jgi:hypothetical protein